MTLPLPLAAVPLAEQGPWLAELEALGYTDLWSAETGALDAFTPLALAAAHTRRARLGAAIVPVFGRGPAVIAMQAAGLAHAAPGRFVLGIGASSPTVARDWNDVAWERPLARVRDSLRFLRRALAGERVDETFETFSVRGFRLETPPAQPPPVFVAALRERMLRLAAREGDGVLLGLLTAEDVARVAAVVREERADAELGLRVAVCPIADAERARAIGRRMLAAYLNVPVYARFHAWLGRGPALRPVWEAWRRGDRRAAAAAVPEPLLDALFVHGPPEACREQLARFVAAGVGTPVVGLFVPGGPDALRAAIRALAPR